MRWSVERRLAFVEERLFWLGNVNRSDLIRRFGVSPSQASNDIGRYLELQPRDVSYDKSAKRYVTGEEFRTVIAEPNATRFLGELRLAGLGIAAGEEALTDAGLPFDATPLPERSIDPYVLRAVLAAIRGCKALVITYQSMSREEPVRRRIAPHAIAHDGFRWHARAFDEESGEYRDFVLGRIRRPRLDGPTSTNPGADRDWETFVELVIAPHPHLTPAQVRAIAIDYGITRGSARLRVRRALLFYALKRLGLDVPPHVRPPNEQHIILLNRAEIEEFAPAAPNV